PTRSEVMKGMLDGTDIAQHMDGDGNSTAAGQDNVEKRRPLAKDGCPGMPVRHGTQSLGGGCGLDTAARDKPRIATSRREAARRQRAALPRMPVRVATATGPRAKLVTAKRNSSAGSSLPSTRTGVGNTLRISVPFNSCPARNSVA